MAERLSEILPLRNATTEDVQQLAHLFATTVRTLGPAFYSPLQIAAWAAATEDTVRFHAWILDAETLVAERENQILGFCGLGADGHITGLYVDAAWTRKGIGTRLLGAVLERANERKLNRCYAEANPFSLPVFERSGFEQTGTEAVERHGQLFRRTLVEKVLTRS
jgi:putative acetyltransferase